MSNVWSVVPFEQPYQMFVGNECDKGKGPLLTGNDLEKKYLGLTRGMAANGVKGGRCWGSY